MAEAKDIDGAKAAVPVVARIISLVGGSFASGFDVAAASLEINRRQERWLDARALDAPDSRAILKARTAHAFAHVERNFDNLARSAAVPIPEPDVIILNGRIVGSGIHPEGLEVVALDRQGHALGQSKTGAGGIFSIKIDADDAEVVLLVTDASGKRLAVDEQVINVKRGAGAFREFDVGRAKGPRREKADLGDRVTMPDVSNVNVEEAASRLREMGFKDIEVTIEPKRQKEGVVTGSDPQPGNLVDPTRPVELTVGKDPEARFDRNLVASVVKVETGEAVPDPAVDGMFETLASKGATGFDRLKSVAGRDDRNFADLSGLPARQATKARDSLLKTMNAIGAIRDGTG